MYLYDVTTRFHIVEKNVCLSKICFGIISASKRNITSKSSAKGGTYEGITYFVISC